VGRQVLLAVIFLLSGAAKLPTSSERMLATGQTGAAAFPLPITWRQFLTAFAATHGTPCPVAVPAWLFRRMDAVSGLSDDRHIDAGLACEGHPRAGLESGVAQPSRRSRRRL
jgi:hypothetical protein